MTNLFLKIDLVFMAAWRNGIASDYDSVIRRLQVRPLRWSYVGKVRFCFSTSGSQSQRKELMVGRESIDPKCERRNMCLHQYSALHRSWLHCQRSSQPSHAPHTTSNTTTSHAHHCEERKTSSAHNHQAQVTSLLTRTADRTH